MQLALRLGGVPMGEIEGWVGQKKGQRPIRCGELVSVCGGHGVNKSTQTLCP